MICLFFFFFFFSLSPQPVPKDEYGKFYTGDSYIVLHTKEVKNHFEYHIHFWIGLESTIDETGAVAYKTVELEEKLGGGAPQYREIQGNEVRAEERKGKAERGRGKGKEKGQRKAKERGME